MTPFTFQSLSFLIVARHEYLRDLLTYALSNFGAEDIHEEESGSGAIAYLERNMPDVLITGLQIGRINGSELVRYVRSQEEDERSRMAIIAYDQRPRMIDVEDALDAGVDDFLRLPFSPATLHRRLLRIVDSRVPEFDLLTGETQFVSTADDLSLPDWLNGWSKVTNEAVDEIHDETPLLSVEEIRAILDPN